MKLKNLLTAALVVASMVSVNAQTLFFSQYTEGAAGYEKAFEIYNPTGAAVDLSTVVVKASNNGAGFGKTFISSVATDDNRYVLSLTGTLAAGDVYVVANAQAVIPEIVNAADLLLTFSSTVNEVGGYNVAAFNGNDALGLYVNGTLVDVIGGEFETVDFTVAGIAAGSKDHTLIRKATVTSGAADWAVGTTQWDVYDDSEQLAQFGAHVVTGIANSNFANFSAYPNPFSNQITISNPAIVSRVVVSNLIGQSVLDINTNGNATIETSNLSAGVYMVSFVAENGTRLVKKMVKR